MAAGGADPGPAPPLCSAAWSRPRRSRAGRAAPVRAAPIDGGTTAAMVTASFRLGRVWGIPIGIHWSLLIVFALLTSSLATNYFPDQYPDLDGVGGWLLAAVTAVLFFASVLLHELGHTWVALRNNIPVKGITLFILGGVAQIGESAKSPGVEFRIAAGGPLVSLALAVGFGALWVVDRGVSYLGAPTSWLAIINLLLLGFNLLPGYPLDGGRMLRAAVWHFSGSEKTGMRIAFLSGQVLSFAFMGIGAFLILSGRFFDGLWLIVIGWFLQGTVIAEQAASTVQGKLGGVTVGEAMTVFTEPEVSSRLKLRQVIDDFILPTGARSVLVVDGEVPRGLISLRDIAKIPREKWDWTAVSEVMTPWARLERVNPGTDLLAALKLMDDKRIGQMPVVETDEGRPVGLLTREEVLHYLRVRAELGM